MTSRTARIVQAVATNLAATGLVAAGRRLLAPLDRPAQRAVVAVVVGQLHAAESEDRSAGTLATWPGAERAAGALRDLLARYDADVQWSALGEMIAGLHGGQPAQAAPTIPPPTGPTELILSVLEDATAPLYACQIVERVQAVDPCITPGHINTVLYRLFKARRVERSGDRCSYRYRLTGAGVPEPLVPPTQRQSTDASTTAPTNGTPGITELVFTVLRAAGLPLTQPEITERVRRLNPRFDASYVAVTLYRQRMRKLDSPIVCYGSTGKLVYSLRSESDGPLLAKLRSSPAANMNGGTGDAVTRRILAELAERPTSDYRALAHTLLGRDDRISIKRVRDRVSRLSRAGHLRRRNDGAWEVPALH